MRYIFDVNRVNGEATEIRMSIQDKTGVATPWHVVESHDKNPTFVGAGNNIEAALKSLLDDVRLTVSERIDAEYNLNDFLTYLKLNADDVVKTAKYQQENTEVDNEQN